MRDIEYYGAQGAQQLLPLASTTNIYGNLKDAEISFIDTIKKYFESLKEYGFYEEEVDVRGIWSKEKPLPHQIIVECSALKSTTEGFGKNAMPVFYTPDSTSDTYEYIMIGGRFEMNTTIKCRSTERSAVMHLADALITGLQGDIYETLKAEEITIPFNTIKYDDKPTKEVSDKQISYWIISLTMPQVSMNWKSIREVDGELIKNFKFIISQSQ